MENTYITLNDDTIIKLVPHNTPLIPVEAATLRVGGLSRSDSPAELHLNTADSPAQAALNMLIADALGASASRIYSSPYGYLHSSLFMPLTAPEERIFGTGYCGLFMYSRTLALLIKSERNSLFLTAVQRIDFNPKSEIH